MTTTPPPAPAPAANDSRTASIAWAVAVIVVALVVGLIAWLALGPDSQGRAGSQQAPATAEAPPAAEAPATGAPEAPPTGAPEASAEDPAAQTPSPELAQMMLSLQRRDADDLLAVGDVEAPVVMIEYADYRCPYCARFTLETRPALQDLVDEGTLRIEFRDFVIFDEQSHAAAVAARAAAEQGVGQEFAAAVFARSSSGHAELARRDLLDVAEEAGVPDLARFEERMDAPDLVADVDADTAEARALGLSSTPTFLVNTTVVRGAQPAEHFQQVIAKELERAQAAD
ncbi:DsbA family protein [Ornithinimicrobium avium]|uniref:Disulfide bond formation protein n=1 Tax=Ornithinimicrobium avium TaxID=2283195 RepID=A0A345NN75_9MICO|nr:thioredoxin domain-containing protein [Ornithinimicrobium avium]AXH96483.1 disulfide bond formation protein [Ornithinimicrobium avium]